MLRAKPQDDLTQVAMLYDATRCTGNRACQVACKAWNDQPGEKTAFRGSYQNPPEISGTTWTLITFRETAEGFPQKRWNFGLSRCVHCTDANCVTACPTGAQEHHPLGFVVTNQATCIGCEACVTACPYEAPVLDPAAGTVKKCTMCWDRVLNGLEPACVKVCPTDALQFGPRDDLLARAHQRVRQLQELGWQNVQLYGEKEFDGLHQLYILGDRPSAYGIPEPSHSASKTWLASWVAGIATLFPLVAVGFAAIFRDRGQAEAGRGGVRE